MLFHTFKAVILLAVVVSGLPAFAQAADKPVDSRSISVTGYGEAAGVPDQAQISAGVQTLATTVVESSQRNQAIVERIMKALDEQGIEKQAIQTANYSIWPDQRQDPRGNGEIAITGYNVNNIVNVTVDDIDKVSTVLAAITNAGANSIQGINFGVKDTASLEQSARAAAMSDARARAKALAELASVDLGEVLTISMSAGGGPPMPMMRESRFDTASAAPMPGISPGQLSVAVQVYVTFAIR
jgi:uncharacterized protein YggE